MNKEEKGSVKKHKLIEYANGPSLEEINGTIEVPKNMSFGKLYLHIQGLVHWSPWATWIPVIGQLQSPVGKISSTC